MRGSFFPRLVQSSGIALPGIALVLSACSLRQETVFVPLEVNFEEDASASPEEQESTEISLILSAPANDDIRVALTVFDESASGHDRCDGRDYSVSQTEVTFKKGEDTVTLSLHHLNDDLPEIDERFRILIAGVSSGHVGPQKVHLHEIVDDDRGALLNVKSDFGAKGNGQSEDTPMIQEAIDRAKNSEDAVVYFPEGEYLTAELTLTPGVVYAGYNAKLLQKSGQTNDARLLHLIYRGNEDSPLTRFQGLTLDAQRHLQGSFENWEFQESVLLLAEADPGAAGLLRLSLQDFTTQNSGGNGIILGTNTESQVCGLQGDEIFTDLLKLSGGNSRLDLREVTAGGSVGTTGIALTGQNAGFGATRKVSVQMENIALLTGDLEIDVQEGSEIVARGIEMSSPPFYLRAVHSKVQLSDSELMMGPPSFRRNRIVAPGNTTFENCDLVLSETIEFGETVEEEDRQLAWANVTWNDVDYAYSDEEEDRLIEELRDQSLTFRDCRFQLSEDLESSDELFAAGFVDDAQDPSNTLTFYGTHVDSEYDNDFAPSCTSCSEP